MQNLLLKMPHKFKKSYGGTPEPQTPHDACVDGIRGISEYIRMFRVTLEWRVLLFG
jgi:hypothetical protein